METAASLLPEGNPYLKLLLHSHISGMRCRGIWKIMSVISESVKVLRKSMRASGSFLLLVIRKR